MRRAHNACVFAAVPTGLRLQNAHLSTMRREAYRAIEVIGIAVMGMARDYECLAIHGSSEVRASAVIADETDRNAPAPRKLRAAGHR